MIHEIVKENENYNDWLKRINTNLLICYSDGCVQVSVINLQFTLLLVFNCIYLITIIIFYWCIINYYYILLIFYYLLSTL